MNDRKARLLASVHPIDQTGTVWAIGPGGAQPLYNVNGVPDDYRHVVASAPLMFVAITNAIPGFDSICELLEKHGLDEAVGPVLELQASLATAQLAALVGLQNIANRQK